jgi:predicted Zn-dependent protease
VLACDGAQRCVSGLRLCAAALIAAAPLVLAGCETNPLTGRPSLVLIAPGQEVTLGQESFRAIRKPEKVSPDVGAHARVKRVGKRIAQAVGDQLPKAQWSFVVFESKDMNAFALPGVDVGVYTGLLALAENDSGLAIVMGHEVGHAIARHGTERMSAAMVMGGAGAISAAAVAVKNRPADTEPFSPR